MITKEKIELFLNARADSRLDEVVASLNAGDTKKADPWTRNDVLAVAALNGLDQMHADHCPALKAAA